MALGGNTLSPLQIADAREAAFKASELQRDVEDRIRTTSGALADAERLYRKALSEKIVTVHADDEVAWTVARDVARGDKRVADLRYARDVAAGVFESAKQEAFRRGADRRDLDTLLNWSARRDLRVDAEPADWDKQPTHGQSLRSAA